MLHVRFKIEICTIVQENNFFSKIDGFPCEPFPNGWKGENGLYAVGFNKRGLLGTSIEARKIAEDIEGLWKLKSVQYRAFGNSTQTLQA